MLWDCYKGLITVLGSIPVDYNAAPEIGDSVLLTKLGLEFEICVKEIDDKEIYGFVMRIIGNDPLDRVGVSVGSLVNFRVNHIRTLSKA